MSKRGATSELNRDNWNDEEEPEEAGTWKQAPSEAIKGRVFKQARRRLAADGQDEDKPKAFAGFAGFSKKEAPATGLFSFLSQTKQPAPVASPVKTVENGSSSASADDSSEKEYLASLRVLNETVTTWIADHVKKNPCCVLTPIFQDYEKHLKELESKRSAAVKQTPSSQTTSTLKLGSSLSQSEAATKTSFSFSSTLASNAMPTPVTPAIETPASTFSFGLGSKPTSTAPAADKPASTFSFGLGSKSTLTASATETPASTFSFGLGSKPFASSTEEKKEGAAAPFSFSFGSVKPVAAEAKKEEAEKDNDEDDEDAPPKVEIKPVQEDDAFYSIRCKLFYKKDASYAEKGVGTLHLKKTKEDKTQLVIRADTTLGNILLNIFLNPQITTQRVGKNNVMLVCVPNPPIDPKNPSSVPTPMLLRVKTDSDADQLLKKLDEAKQ